MQSFAKQLIFEAALRQDLLLFIQIYRELLAFLYPVLGSRQLRATEKKAVPHLSPLFFSLAHPLFSLFPNPRKPGTGYLFLHRLMYFCTCRSFDAFPPLPPVTWFPALADRHIVSRAFRPSHLFRACRP